MTRLSLVAFLFIWGFSNAQSNQFEVIELLKEDGYIHSIRQSKNNTYIGYGVASYYTRVIDTSFNIKFTFDINPLWGGGGICFSDNEKYAAYYAYGESDTLYIVDLAKGTKSSKIFKDIAGIEFVNESNEILVYSDYSVHLYDYHKKKINKSIEIPDAILALAIDNDQHHFYVLCNGNVKYYNTIDLSIIGKICITTSEDYHMWHSDKYLVLKESESIIVYSLLTGEELSRLNPSLGYITDLLIMDDSIYVIGRKPLLYTYSLTSKETSTSKLDINEKGAFGILKMHNGKLLISDTRLLYHLK